MCNRIVEEGFVEWSLVNGKSHRNVKLLLLFAPYE